MSVARHRLGFAATRGALPLDFFKTLLHKNGKRANLLHEVSRHHFGEKQLGWTHTLTENILMLDSERR